MSYELNSSEYNFFKFECGSGNHLYGARNSHIMLAIVGHSYCTRVLLYLGRDFSTSAFHSVISIRVQFREMFHNNRRILIFNFQ
jgi:hypothetical protein